MRYLTHAILHHCEENPHRAVRDSFGLDSAACWCSLLTSPALPAAHSLANVPAAILHHHHSIKKRETNRLTLHPEFSFENVILTGAATLANSESYEGIELRDLSRRRPHSHSTRASAPPSPAPSLPAQSPAWPTPPPPAAHRRLHNHNHPQHNHPIPLNNLPRLPATSNNPPPPPTTPSQ